MRRKRRAGSIELPDYVWAQVSRGKPYYYFQKGRGTKNPGPRHRLPDIRAPEFWPAYRALLGEDNALPPLTVDSAIDKWLIDVRAKKGIQPSSALFYEQSVRPARKAWGALSPAGLKARHVEALFHSMDAIPGAANNFLSAMRSFGKWLRKHEYSAVMITEGLTAHKAEAGHMPWTAEQLAIAEAKLTGAVRRGFFLYRYSGMRGSDVVRLCPHHIDDGGFEIITQKRKVPIFCPILPELETEMAGWTTVDGPLLRQQGGRADGKPYTRKLFSKHFAAQRDKIAGLAGLTLHGLRATAVGRYRAGGMTVPQICDIVGMSPAMVERYSRNVDRKASAKAGVRQMLQTEQEARIAKQSKNAKQDGSKNNKLGNRR
ncbi:integrase family protein [Rhizobium sp. PDO1-076]|uniref:tyrosine-type recombinase/integrase n=1 Tax=Rhizobium sp. PDO1-076 TaxID=1125979 RepID=UPI00024E2CA4|nr:hypothetical protein [Rhizobium sp. PDO1-076]EHS53011.1 integrase family protein [Rhizobium sp. PDO1-076]